MPPGFGPCTFGAKLINSSDWQFVGFVTSCIPTDKYSSGNSTFSIFEEMIPANYNNTVTYPFQIILSARAIAYVPIYTSSQPYTLQITS